MDFLVIPGILTDDIGEIKRKVELIQGVVPRVSIDIIDGKFANNRTVEVSELNQVGGGSTKFEVQLMVEEPVDFLQVCNKVGAARVYGHIEKMGGRTKFLQAARRFGFEIGWALDVDTPHEGLSDEELVKVTGILLMSVKTGFSGQKFIDITPKISAIRQRGFTGDIVIDGNMNEETIPLVMKAGANQFSATSAVWNNSDPIHKWRMLMELVSKREEEI